MQQQEAGGAIVNISSVSAHRPSPDDRGVRRGEGRPRLADAVAGGRVGPEGARQLHRRRPVPHRAHRRPLRRRRPGRRDRAHHPARPDGPARGGRQRRGLPRQRPRVVRLRRSGRVPRRRRAARLPCTSWRSSHEACWRVASRSSPARAAGSAGRTRSSWPRTAPRSSSTTTASRWPARAPASRRPTRSSPRSTAAGGRAVANGADVADFEQAAAMVQQAIDTFGGLDILVNNAGFVRDRMLVNTSEEEWDAVIRVHLKGHFAPLRHAGAYWRAEAKEGRQRAARVINTSLRRRAAGLGRPGDVLRRQGRDRRAHPGRRPGAGPVRRHGQRDRAGGEDPDDRGRLRHLGDGAARGQLADRRLARLRGGRRRDRPGDRGRRQHDHRRDRLGARPLPRRRSPLGRDRGRAGAAGAAGRGADTRTGVRRPEPGRPRLRSCGGRAAIGLVLGAALLLAGCRDDADRDSEPDVADHVDAGVRGAVRAPSADTRGRAIGASTGRRSTGWPTDARAAGSNCFLVAQRGHVLGEWYWKDGGPDTAQEVFSVTKSVTSTLVGIAQADGSLERRATRRRPGSRSGRGRLARTSRCATCSPTTAAATGHRPATTAT